MITRRVAVLVAAVAAATGLLMPSLAAADTVQSTAWNFDASAVGTIPSGCSTPSGRAGIPVSAAVAPAGHTHSVELTESGSALPVLQCAQSATADATLSFQVRPQAMTNGFMVDLMGDSTAGPQSNPLVHVLFAASGAVQWYNGSAWQTVASTGAPPVGQWSTVQLSVDVGANTVDVSVNGVLVGEGGSWSLNPLTAFTGFQFAGTGTTHTGDDIYFGSPTLVGTTPVHTMWWNLEAGATGSVPANCQTPSGRAPLTISSTTAVPGSTHSLQLTESGTALPVVQCTASAGTVNGVGTALRFAVYPKQLAYGFMVDLMGSSTAGAQSNPVFHIMFDANGSVQWYQGYDATTWMPLAATGGPAVGQWSTVEVATTADMDMAYVSVNGRYLGSAGSWSINPTTSITGIQFAGTGTTRTGDVVYFGSPGMFPALADRPSAVTSQYQIGATSTIASGPASTSTPLQMPDSAVQVPGPSGGERILAEYPMHADAATATGNELAYSDDGGATWHSDQSANPMPGVPSYNLTRLADGTLLATGYHTYTTAPGGTAVPADEAVVESAVSTDDGQTWTVRYGTLTAPQSIAPYTCEQSSGCTAIVLVHSVIQGPDGTIYQSAYGRYTTDPSGGYRQLVLASHDGGLTWTVQATVATASSTFPNGFTEGALAWAGNGDMIVVMRTGSYSPMYISRSSGGVTWSTPQEITGSDGSPVISIYPNIVPLGDGSLLLLVGRPGLSLLRSTDGGLTWSRQTWVDYNDSGNAAMTGLGGNSVLILGDRGQDWLSPMPQSMAVWSRTVGVVG